MDILDEVENIREVEADNEEAETEAEAENEILQLKFDGLLKAYLKARKKDQWKMAHDLLVEIIFTQESIRSNYWIIKDASQTLPGRLLEILR
jgi:hypothetical protein